MIFAEKYIEQFKMILVDGVSTRSSKVTIPLHEEIAKYIMNNSNYSTQLEYKFVGPYGSKKVDIAILDKENNLKGAILFKGVKSSYNKNANNYFEGMRGESQLFIDAGVPIYQIIFIPTKIKIGDKYEIPTKESYNNYFNYISKGYVPKSLKVGVFYFDVDYQNFKIEYSEKRIDGVEDTLTEGLNNFLKSVI